MIRFGVKAGIASSAVYLTVASGVWKDSETTTELYNKMKEGMSPYTTAVVEQIPFEIPKMPKTGDMCSSAKTAWNKGVMASCLFLSECCDKAWDHTVNGIKYGYDKIREGLDSIPETET